MPQHKKSLAPTKILLASIVAISMAACSNGNQTTTSSPTDSASSTPSSPTAVATSVSAKATASSVKVVIPGVTNIGEINFKVPKDYPRGFFDGVDNSAAPTIKVPKATRRISANGWATIDGKTKPADRVIITFGDNNAVVAAAPVNSPRPDVAKALKNPTTKNLGWIATFNSSILPAGPVLLKAWAYNSANKEAIQLNNTHEVIISK